MSDRIAVMDQRRRRAGRGAARALRAARDARSSPASSASRTSSTCGRTRTRERLRRAWSSARASGSSRRSAESEPEKLADHRPAGEDQVRRRSASRHRSVVGDGRRRRLPRLDDAVHRRAADRRAARRAPAERRGSEADPSRSATDVTLHWAAEHSFVIERGRGGGGRPAPPRPRATRGDGGGSLSRPSERRSHDGSRTASSRGGDSSR